MAALEPRLFLARAPITLMSGIERCHLHGLDPGRRVHAQAGRPAGLMVSSGFFLAFMMLGSVT